MASWSLVDMSQTSSRLFFFPYPLLANTNLLSWLIASPREWHVLGQLNSYIMGNITVCGDLRNYSYPSIEPQGLLIAGKSIPAPFTVPHGEKTRQKARCMAVNRVQRGGTVHILVSSSCVHPSVCNPSHHSLCHTQCRPHTWFDIHSRWPFRGRKMADFIGWAACSYLSAEAEAGSTVRPGGLTDHMSVWTDWFCWWLLTTNSSMPLMY